MRSREGGKSLHLILIIKAEDAQLCASSVFFICRQTGCPFLMNIRENILFDGINRYLCRTIKKNNIIILTLKP